MTHHKFTCLLRFLSFGYHPIYNSVKASAVIKADVILQTNGPRNTKMCLPTYADNDGQDQVNKGLRCPLPESLDTIECTSGKQMPG